MRNMYKGNSYSVRRLGVLFTLVFLWVSYAATPAASSATDDVERRVNAILSQMTLDEKIDMLGGINEMFIRPLPRLGLPSFKKGEGTPCVFDIVLPTTLAQ